MIEAKDEFEKWFLGLNREFDKQDLSVIRGIYFYTTTQVLYLQFIKIKEYEELLESMMGFHNVLAKRTKEVMDKEGKWLT